MRKEVEEPKAQSPVSVMLPQHQDQIEVAIALRSWNGGLTFLAPSRGQSC